NLSLEDAEKTIEGSFAKSFQDTTDQKKFEIMRFIFLQLVKNIPINPLNDLLSEGTLTPNTASMSAKVTKLANFDPSRAKQPDMISNVVNNNKSYYEMIFGEIIGEGKNNKTKKNDLDLIRLGVFMKDTLDILVKKLRKDRIVFSWQSIVLVAPRLYFMIDIDYTELPKSFQTCGQFINEVAFSEPEIHLLNAVKNYWLCLGRAHDIIAVKLMRSDKIISKLKVWYFCTDKRTQNGELIPVS
ncbi:10565_t:CDS:2, partial [Funneliformis caledonium]